MKYFFQNTKLESYLILSAYADIYSSFKNGHVSEYCND